MGLAAGGRFDAEVTTVLRQGCMGVYASNFNIANTLV